MPPKLVPPDGLSEGALGYTKVIGAAYPDSEDCKRFLQFEPMQSSPSPKFLGLNLDIIRPAGTTPDSKFPVVVVRWVFSRTARGPC